MPSKKITYTCKYCGKEYSDYEECREHEGAHISDYDDIDTKEIAQKLREVGKAAYCYHIGYMVLGMPARNFENLMDEAAKRLEDALESVEALKKRFTDGMNVHRQGDDADDGIECPFCGYEVARNDDYKEMRPKHCPECGTKLIY